MSIRKSFLIAHMYIHVFTSVYTHMYLCIIWNSVQRLCPSFLQVRKVSPASRELKEIKETKASLELKVFPDPQAPRVLTISSKGSQGSPVLRAPQG